MATPTLSTSRFRKLVLPAPANPHRKPFASSTCRTRIPHVPAVVRVGSLDDDDDAGKHIVPMPTIPLPYLSSLSPSAPMYGPVLTPAKASALGGLVNTSIFFSDTGYSLVCCHRGCAHVPITRPLAACRPPPTPSAWRSVSSSQRYSVVLQHPWQGGQPGEYTCQYDAIPVNLLT